MRRIREFEGLIQAENLDQEEVCPILSNFSSAYLTDFSDVAIFLRAQFKRKIEIFLFREIFFEKFFFHFFVEKNFQWIFFIF